MIMVNKNQDANVTPVEVQAPKANKAWMFFKGYLFLEKSRNGDFLPYFIPVKLVIWVIFKGKFVRRTQK